MGRSQKGRSRRCRPQSKTLPVPVPLSSLKRPFGPGNHLDARVHPPETYRPLTPHSHPQAGAEAAALDPRGVSTWPRCVLVPWRHGRRSPSADWAQLHRVRL